MSSEYHQRIKEEENDGIKNSKSSFSCEHLSEYHQYGLKADRKTVAVFSMDRRVQQLQQNEFEDGGYLDPAVQAVNKKLMRLSVDGRVSAKRSSVLFDNSAPIPSENEVIFKEPLGESTVGRIRVKQLVSSETRFPRIEEMSHFHYNNVEFPGKLRVSLCEDQNSEGNTETGDSTLIKVSCSEANWIIKRSYQDFVGLDRQLHRCIYARSYSKLDYLDEDETDIKRNIDEKMKERISEYLQRLDEIAGNNLNCGPILNWFELENHGNHLVVMEADDSAINVPAIAAAHVIKRYVAQAPDEISLEVGEFVSVIDMPPGEETIWWRGKKGFEVGFFPSSCVDILIDKELDSQLIQHTMIQRPISKRRGKFISFLRYFFRSRPSKDELMQTGILRERTFGCDLGEHLASSKREIPLVLEMCSSVIEEHGIVDGIYRLSGITSNMQRLRLAFDNEEPPNLIDSRYLHDIHCISSLLKTYFRELPNPLLTYELYDKFMAAMRKNDDTERTVAFHHAIQRLPPPHYRTLEFLLRHLEKCASFSGITSMNEKNIAIVWAPNLLKPNVKDPGGAALLDIRNQAIIIEYLLKNVSIFFDKNLASAAIAFYPETDDVTTPTSENGYTKDFVLDRGHLERLGSSPPKLISLTEARARLKENNKISEPEQKVDGVDKPRRKSRPPSNPTIPASVPISPGPSLLSLEEAQARSKVKGQNMLRRGSVDFAKLQSRINKVNQSDIAPKKRSWKGLFSRNKSISSELDSYGEDRKTQTLATFKRRVSYDAGDPSGLSTPRSQSSFNLRELESQSANVRPAQNKKGRKKKLEISSPLGIRTSSFVSYVGGINELERTSTAPEVDLRQVAKAARAKTYARSKSTDNVNSLKEESQHTVVDNEYRPTLEVINDVSTDTPIYLKPDEGNKELDVKENLEQTTDLLDESDSREPKDLNLAEVDRLVVNCSSSGNGESISNASSPIDEKVLRNSMWIDKYDEIARTCSSAASLSDKENKPNNDEKGLNHDLSNVAVEKVENHEELSPRRKQPAEIRHSLLSRGSRELQSHGNLGRKLSDTLERRSRSVDIPEKNDDLDKRASCLSDGGIPRTIVADTVNSLDWVPVMQRSLTSASDHKCSMPVKFPLQSQEKGVCSVKGLEARKDWTARPFSSYDNYPLAQTVGTDDESTDRKIRNRPSFYDNLL